MSWTEKRAQMRKSLRSLNAAIPETTAGFGTLSKAAKSSGPLDLKTKELIAISIAVTDRCEPCIFFHVDALIKAGGTREELADTLGMCIQMGGGPALMYAAKTLECFDEFSSAAT